MFFGKTQINSNFTLRQNVYIKNNLGIGSHCRIQNNVSVYKGVTPEDVIFADPVAYIKTY